MADRPPVAISLLKLSEHRFRLQEPARKVQVRKRPAKVGWKVVNSLEHICKSVLVRSHQHHHTHGAATLKFPLEISPSTSTRRIPSDDYYRLFI